MTANARPHTAVRPGHPTGAADVLAHAQANRAVVQDFVRCGLDNRPSA